MTGGTSRDGRAGRVTVERWLSRLRVGVSSLVPLDQRTDLRHRLGRYRPAEGGFDLVAPPAPTGEESGPPDFVGVGVPMAGCQWWFAGITDHPGTTGPHVAGAARHVLSHFASARFGAEEAAAYHRWFPRVPGTLTGEWTPTYLGDPWVAPLLAQACPEARILVLVMDPVARLQLDLARSAEHRLANAGVHTAEAIDRGFYAAQLRWLYHWVPPERVLVLQAERCLLHPAEELAATYRFLGLDDSHRVPHLGVPAARLAAPLAPDVEDRLVELYADDAADLRALAPSVDLSLWPRFSRAGSGRGRRPGEPGPGSVGPEATPSGGPERT